MRKLLWVSFMSAAVLALALAVVLNSPAMAQEQKDKFKPDIKKTMILKEGKNHLCPPNSAALYISGRKVCAKCPPDYNAIEEKGRVICIRSTLGPTMRVPDGYQPDFKQVNAKGKCPGNMNAVKLNGKKLCIKCKPGYRYHPYYGQGRCLICKKHESLAEIGGKIMCLSCPGNISLLGRYASPSKDCVCTQGRVFGWGEKGYGCYRRQAR